MKNAFQMILALTVVGLIALLAAAFYFGAPLFGWIIMVAIFAVFIGEQLVALKTVKQVAAENEILETCKNRGGYVSGDGVVAKRVALAKNLIAKKIRLDSSMAYEVLSNSVGIAIPRSAGGSVILLGLMGTFFGLMYSVATAGGAIDNSTTQGTLDTIQLLFQNMKGIFGTSLCGLFAALILNASRNMMMASRDEFVARLDAYTLDLQGDSEAEESEEARAKDELERLFDSVEKNLSTVASSVKEGLSGVAASTEKSMDGAVKNIADCVSAQVKQSDEQWKAFMDKLASESSASTESQKQGLETLKNVALQVAEKAQAGSAELSNSVAEKLSALSNDILAAFQKLSETSATLLEAQKALTESIDNRVVKEKEATDALGGNIVETAELMRVNQSELSANLEMLRSGLETILEKLSGDTAEHEEEDNFVEHLNQSLEAFHERASEVLMENAVKTQEILLEVLEQTQRSAIPAQPKAEG